MSTAKPILFQTRPRKVTFIAGISAAVVLSTMVVVGVLLQRSEAGTAFRVADQVGLIGIGVVLAAIIMTAGRPRLRADEDGLRVRNVLGETHFPWNTVVRIAFPEGSPWAQLILPDDEMHPVMAIQAMDRGRAVEALKAVRELHAKFAPEPPAPTAEALAEREHSERDEYRRPLGRLEIIDREKYNQRQQRNQSNQP